MTRAAPVSYSEHLGPEIHFLRERESLTDSLRWLGAFCLHCDSHAFVLYLSFRLLPQLRKSVTSLCKPGLGRGRPPPEKIILLLDRNWWGGCSPFVESTGMTRTTSPSSNCQQPSRCRGPAILAGDLKARRLLPRPYCHSEHSTAPTLHFCWVPISVCPVHAA